MKNKILTAVSAMMLFIPWTILPLRSSFQWALDYAEIVIFCYAAFMIFSGIFTILSYSKANVQHGFMKACLIINSLYAVGGAAAIAMMMQNNI